MSSCGNFSLGYFVASSGENDCKQSIIPTYSFNLLGSLRIDSIDWFSFLRCDALVRESARWSVIVENRHCSMHNLSLLLKTKKKLNN